MKWLKRFVITLHIGGFLFLGWLAGFERPISGIDLYIAIGFYLVWVCYLIVLIGSTEAKNSLFSLEIEVRKAKLKKRIRDFEKDTDD